MGLLRVRSGTVNGINDTTVWCPLQNRCLTLTVFSPTLETRIPNTQITVFVKAPGAQNYQNPNGDQVTTDRRGRVSLIFLNTDDVARYTIDVQYPHQNNPRRQVTAGETATDDQVFYRASAIFPETYKLVVRVLDMRPVGVAGNPIPLERAIVNVTGSNDVTMDAQGSWEKADMALGQAVTIRPPTALEPVIALSQAARRVAGGNWVDSHDGNQTVANGVTHSCTDQRVVSVQCDTLGLTVEVEFRLKFKCVFIVGEGTGFDYAIQLAKKYAGPVPANNRGLTRHDQDATETTPRDARRWIIASQFDRTQPPGAVGAQQNLQVYRHGTGNPDFDTTSQGCWDQLRLTFTERFDAIVFNNPHPGYQIHQCMNKNLNPQVQEQGLYLVVHTLGLGNNALVTQQSAEQFWFPLQDRDNAGVQRTFVRTNNEHCLNYQCDINAARIMDFSDGRQYTIPESFQYLQGGGNIDPAQFPNETRHYTPGRNTRGLYDHIIIEYRRLAPGALKPGGWLYINGASAVERAVRRGLDNRLVVNGALDWHVHGELYANYPTNFTHNAGVHPSWLAIWERWPGEPNLDRAKTYALQI